MGAWRGLIRDSSLERHVTRGARQPIAMHHDCPANACGLRATVTTEPAMGLKRWAAGGIGRVEMQKGIPRRRGLAERGPVIGRHQMRHEKGGSRHPAGIGLASSVAGLSWPFGPCRGPLKLSRLPGRTRGMSRRNVILIAALTSLSTVVAGCTPDHGTAPTAEKPASPSPATRAFAQRGSHGERFSARIEVLGDGTESLKGESLIPNAEGGSWVVNEEARLDPDGRLLLAVIKLVDRDTGLWRRTMRLDAQRGEWQTRDIQGDRAGTASRQYPWTWSSVFEAEATEAEVITPVAAWVTARAAMSAEAVTLIGVNGAESTAMSDQVLVVDGAERWIVIGDEVVEAGADFVELLPAYEAVARGEHRTGGATGTSM